MLGRQRTYELGCGLLQLAYVINSIHIVFTQSKPHERIIIAFEATIKKHINRA